MGSFDHYAPTRVLVCPWCREVLSDWQGKDGPCEQLEWIHGVSSPVGQLVDDRWMVPVAVRENFRLPERFLIYSDCGRCQHLLWAAGSCKGDAWSETVPLGRHPDDDVVQASALSGRLRQCAACCDAWEENPAHELVVCPKCATLTRLEDVALPEEV